MSRQENRFSWNKLSDRRGQNNQRFRHRRYILLKRAFSAGLSRRPAGIPPHSDYGFTEKRELSLAQNLTKIRGVTTMDRDDAYHQYPGTGKSHHSDRARLCFQSRAATASGKLEQTLRCLSRHVVLSGLEANAVSNGDPTDDAAAHESG